MPFLRKKASCCRILLLLSAALAAIPVSARDLRPGAGGGFRGRWREDWEKEQQERRKQLQEERRARAMNQAIDAARDYLAVRWIESEMPAVKATSKTKLLEACVKSMRKKSGGRRPVLVLFVSTEERNGKPTRQARASTKLLLEVFDGEVDPERISRADFRVPIAAKFFDCFLIDVADITSRDNRFISNRNVPVAVMADGSGRINKVCYTAGQCSRRVIVGSACRIFKAEHPAFKQTLAHANNLLIRFIKADSSARMNTIDRQAVSESLQWARTREEATTILDRIRPTWEKGFLARIERYKAIKETYFLLQEQGLRGKALPPVPKRPADPTLKAALRTVHKAVYFKQKTIRPEKGKDWKPPPDLPGFVSKVVSMAGEDTNPAAPFLLYFLAMPDAEQGLTRQADASLELWDDIFRGAVNIDDLRKSDFSASITARLFNCGIVNVTQINATQNPAICRTTAPVIVLAEPSGKIISALTKQRGPETVYAHMQKLLAGKTCIKRISQANRALQELLATAYDAAAGSREKAWVEEILRNLQRDFGRPPARLAATREFLESRLDNLQKQISTAESKRERARKSWDSLREQVVSMGLAKQWRTAKTTMPAAAAAAKPDKAKPANPKPAATSGSRAAKPDRPDRAAAPLTFKPVSKRELRAAIADYVGRGIEINFVFRGTCPVSAATRTKYPFLPAGTSLELVNKFNYLDASAGGISRLRGIHVLLPASTDKAAGPLAGAQPGDTLILRCVVERSDGSKTYFLRVHDLVLPPPCKGTP